MVDSFLLGEPLESNGYGFEHLVSGAVVSAMGLAERSNVHFGSHNTKWDIRRPDLGSGAVVSAMVLKETVKC